MKELGVYFTRSKKIEVIFEKSKGRKAKDFHFSIKTPDPDAKPTDTGAKQNIFQSSSGFSRRGPKTRARGTPPALKAHG